MKNERKKKNGTSMSTEDNEINTDPLGSWTGTPNDPYEMPTQDADDL